MPGLIQLILPRRILPHQPENPKPWHEFDILTTDMRRYSIQKIIYAISPIQDAKIFNDRRFKNIVNKGIRIECLIYDEAEDCDDYLIKVDEKILKIKEDKCNHEANQPAVQTFAISEDERRNRNLTFQRILVLLHDRDIPEVF
ncbi:CREB-binding [Brachionus plicatilis]|uniref:CREB-binding n=1 Tax=Brachionus plicatilis TaxID=10195 RepID=A0A3M7S5U7_BRAPC|nr:CREB-binding [Brachionus plicatilis]